MCVCVGVLFFSCNLLRVCVFYFFSCNLLFVGVGVGVCLCSSFFM